MTNNKEEILKKHIINCDPYTELWWRGFNKSMDEYAKQVAIEFRNWEPPVGTYENDEQLYSLWEQTKKKVL